MSHVRWVWSFILVYNKIRVFHVGNHWIDSFCGSCFEYCTHCSTLHGVRKHHSLLFGFYTWILNIGFPLHCQIAHRLVYGCCRCSSAISYCVPVPSQWCIAVQIHVWCARCVMSDYKNPNPCLDSILKAIQALVILNVAVPPKRWLCISTLTWFGLWCGSSWRVENISLFPISVPGAQPLTLCFTMLHASY